MPEIEAEIASWALDFHRSSIPGVLDIRTGLAGSVLQDRMVLEIAAAPGRVVLNTSLGAPAPATRAAAPWRRPARAP